MKYLCQDCLKVHEFEPDHVSKADEENGDGNRLCDCGGDVCGCTGCVDMIGETPVGQFAPKGLPMAPYSVQAA